MTPEAVSTVTLWRTYNVSLTEQSRDLQVSAYCSYVVSEAKESEKEKKGFLFEDSIRHSYVFLIKKNQWLNLSAGTFMFCLFASFC